MKRALWIGCEAPSKRCAWSFPGPSITSLDPSSIVIHSRWLRALARIPIVSHRETVYCSAWDYKKRWVGRGYPVLLATHQACLPGIFHCRISTPLEHPILSSQLVCRPLTRCGHHTTRTSALRGLAPNALDRPPPQIETRLPRLAALVRETRSRSATKRMRGQPPQAVSLR